MDKLSALGRLFEHGKISRRDFMSQALALGATTALATSMASLIATLGGAFRLTTISYIAIRSMFLSTVANWPIGHEGANLPISSSIRSRCSMTPLINSRA